MKQFATGLACLALMLSFSTADAAKKAKESKSVEAGTTYLVNVSGIS